MMIPLVRAWSAACTYTCRVRSRSWLAATAPTSSTTRSNEMFSSWLPNSAFVAGVNNGSVNLLASTNPGGNAIPQTFPVAW